jgi:putative NADPH-quinone reductase
MNYDLEMRDQLVARLRRRLNKVLDEKAKAARFDMQNAYDYLHRLQNDLEQEIREYE